MAITTGVLFFTLFLGALALPTPLEEDMGLFFEIESVGAAGRIVGGRQAGPHPWLVSLTSGGTARHHFCGGSIINRRTILTAAHCLWAIRTGNLQQNAVRVNAGTNRFNSGGQSMTVRGFAIHPSYRHVIPPHNDVATLFMTNLLNLNNAVQRVAISWDFIGGGMSSRIAGWGSTRAPNSPTSVQLMEIDTVTMTGAQCNHALRNHRYNIVDSIELCISNPRGRGICTGDSGGPLMRNDRRQQIGIAAWVIGCGVGNPDMFARVSAFRTWINQNTQGE